MGYYIAAIIGAGIGFLACALLSSSQKTDEFEAQCHRDLSSPDVLSALERRCVLECREVSDEEM